MSGIDLLTSVRSWVDADVAFYIDSNYINAFGSDLKIRFDKINDSTIHVFYPKKTLTLYAEFKDFFDFENIMKGGYRRHRWVNVSTKENILDRGSYEYDIRTNEIIFGADRLNYSTIDSSRIKLKFPKRSVWYLKTISDEPWYEKLLIYNGLNEQVYHAQLE